MMVCWVRQVLTCIHTLTLWGWFILQMETVSLERWRNTANFTQLVRGWARTEIWFVQLRGPLSFVLNWSHQKPKQQDSRKYYYLAKGLSDVYIAIIVLIHDNSFHGHPKLLLKMGKLWLMNGQIRFLYMEIYSFKLQGKKIHKLYHTQLMW